MCVQCNKQIFTITSVGRGTASIVGIRVGHDLQAGEVCVDAVDGGGVLCREVLGCTVGASEDHRNAELAARHLVDLGRAVDDLVVGHEREVPGHELDDGTHAQPSVGE